MSIKTFTVFTPTYNRGYKIADLYRSLCNQTCTDFEWLIVDDGSTDNTQELVEQFKREGILDIRYYLKENGGKHTAINMASDLAYGEWFFIVDSDDYLTNDALERALYYCKTVEADSRCAGVVGLRGNIKGEVWATGSVEKINKHKTGNVKGVEKEYIDASAVDYRYKYKIQGDRAEIVKTNIIKNYKFPVFSDERFMPESYLWFSLSRDGYYMRWFNRVIYITEYLEDGLTQNGKELAKKSSKSRALVDDLAVSIPGIPIKDKVKMAINYYRYGRYSGNTIVDLFKNSSNKILSILVIPIALITKIR